jgi:hypothetical protein
MLQNFNLSKNIPPEKQVSAYLTVMVSCLAYVQALSLEVCELRCLTDKSRNFGVTLDDFEKKVANIQAELKTSLFAKFGQ